MDNVFTYPRELFEKGDLDKTKLTMLITKHRNIEVSRLQKNKDYYDGKHAIAARERKAGAPNTKPSCNHAKDITDTASGYFMGNPVTYDIKEENADTGADIAPLLNAFARAEVNDVDQDNALLLSMTGCSYEYVYAEEGEANLGIRNLDPRNTFIVYDDTIERKELFGVYYYVKKDDVNNREEYVAVVVTDTHIYEYTLYPQSGTGTLDAEPKEHYCGYIPIIEYKNNKYCIGDFEQQIGLIDAYNTLMADRVNDKEQFIDAILVVYGSILGDGASESDKAVQELQQKKLLELPEDAKAEYLTRTFDENGVETLRKALKEDIYTLSHVPNLTDENFAGNSSGVAMEYKLLGLEMLTKTKERYYRKGLRKRIRIFCHFLKLKALELEAENITMTFSRALPKNLLELAQITSILSEEVSQKTLLGLLPFVDDPAEEAEAVKAQKEENAKRQSEMFDHTKNEPVPPDDSAVNNDE